MTPRQPPHIQAVLDRCTRDGHVLWAHVAGQLGRSVDAVRSEYDPSYLKFEPPTVPQPEPIEEAPRRRGRPIRHDGFRANALSVLLDGPKDGDQLASLTGAARASVARNMAKLVQCGLAVRYRQWGRDTLPIYRLSEAGEKRAMGGGG